MKERRTFLEDDTGGEPPRQITSTYIRWAVQCTLWACCGLLLYHTALFAAADSFRPEVLDEPLAPWHSILTPAVLFITFVLAAFSAFFSASEVAFLSLNKIHLRTMRDSAHFLSRLVARLMKRPGSLLTTILMGNNIVNVLLSVTFAEPLSEMFTKSLGFSTAQAYAASITITTCTLLFFCEILPKIIAARQTQSFTLIAAAPLLVVDVVIAPLRGLAMNMVGVLFKVTRLSQVPPASFLTDDEFMTLLEDGKASGVIEEDERQMIQGILEFSDVTLREILLPRPDIVAVKESATVAEALDIVREHEFARMPVYREHLDHIVGILYAKDLLYVTEEGAVDAPIMQYVRKPFFVPKTMSVADFVTTTQHLRTHMAIVVDEYGGTEGLVTLQDALREVVGDIGEEDDVERPLLEELPDDRVRVAGNYPLDDFAETMMVQTQDEEHTTVAGFLMAQSDKILEPGDTLEYHNLHFLVEVVNEKRVESVLVSKIVPPPKEEPE